MTTIDWTKPIELSDGTPAYVLQRHQATGWHQVAFENGDRTFRLDGTPQFRDDNGFIAKVRGRTIRNVAPPAPVAAKGTTLGDALVLLKAGHKVARAGWNGKGMFLYHVPAASYPAQTGAAKAHFGNDAKVPYQAYVAMKTADDTVVPWLCSQSDLLADDWQAVA